MTGCLSQQLCLCICVCWAEIGGHGETQGCFYPYKKDKIFIMKQFTGGYSFMKN